MERTRKMRRMPVLNCTWCQTILLFMIMDGMTGIMQVVRVAIMIIYIGVKITITVFQIIRMRLFIGGKTGLLVLRRVFSSFGMKSCNLALLLDGKRWIIWNGMMHMIRFLNTMDLPKHFLQWMIWPVPWGMWLSIIKVG